MNVKGIIFDFGFTLFYFKDVSIERYMDCYRRGLKKSIDLLENHQILKETSAIKKFNRIFKKKRTSYFQKSIKTKQEFPTSFIFETVLEQMVDKKFIDDLGSKDDDFYNELANLYHSCEEEEWVPFQHTRDTLEKLIKKGLKIGLISNHPHHPTIKNLLKKYDLLEFFDVIMTSAKFGKRKPDPGIFYHTLEKMGLLSRSCMMCGDEHADIVGGHKAGLQTILCERLYKFPFEQEINIPNYIKINNISEILDYLT